VSFINLIGLPSGGPFYYLYVMKRDEIIDLLKIPDEIANKAHIHELKTEVVKLNSEINKLNMKVYRLSKDNENKSQALKRRKIQIEELKQELFIVNQFIDPKYK